MVQLINIPQLQYPGNGVDFAPITNALMYYRKGMTEAQQWDVARRAGERAAAGDMAGAAAEAFRGGNPALGLQLGNEPLQNAMLQAQTGHTQQQTQMLRAQEEQLRNQMALRTRLLDQINGLLGGSDQGTGPAAPSAGPSATSTPDIGPVTPRTVRTLPLTDSGAAMIAPGAAAAAPGAAGPSAAPPPSPPARPDARAYPGTVFSGANAVANWLGGIASPSTPPPIGGYISRPPAAPLAAPSAPAAASPGAQVRGWLDTGEQPDFQGTPMARGVAPAAPAAPVPAAPQPAAPPAPTPAIPSAPVYGAAHPSPPEPNSMVLGLPLDRARRLAVLFDAAGMRNEFLEGEIARAGAVAQEAEKARAQAVGKSTGEAQANLPGAMQSAASMVRNIDAVINDPYLGYVTGFGSSHFNPWAWTPGTPWSRDTMARLDQIRGQAFLQAYNGLRGGGQITEAEGSKAQAAIGRLQDLSQTDEGYVQALNDARYEIWDLANLARRKAGQAPIPYVPSPTDRKRLQRVSNDADFNRLPSGMPFIDPEGNVRTKP